MIDKFEAGSNRDLLIKTLKDIFTHIGGKADVTLSSTTIYFSLSFNTDSSASGTVTVYNVVDNCGLAYVAYFKLIETILLKEKTGLTKEQLFFISNIVMQIIELHTFYTISKNMINYSTPFNESTKTVFNILKEFLEYRKQFIAINYVITDFINQNSKNKQFHITVVSSGKAVPVEELLNVTTDSSSIKIVDIYKFPLFVPAWKKLKEGDCFEYKGQELEIIEINEKGITGTYSYTDNADIAGDRVFIAMDNNSTLTILNAITQKALRNRINKKVFDERNLILERSLLRSANEIKDLNFLSLDAIVENVWYLIYTASGNSSTIVKKTERGLEHITRNTVWEFVRGKDWKFLKLADVSE